MAKNFEKLAAKLIQQGIDINEFKEYLLAKVQTESTQEYSPHPTREETASEISIRSPEIVLIKKIGIRLLTDTKIELNKLNQILATFPKNELSIKLFLQRMLQNRIIKVEEFISFTQGNWEEIPNIQTVYQAKLEQNQLQFFIEKKEISKNYGHYQMIEELARGGMGIIYKCYHPQLNQIFAIKVLIAGEDASESALKRFHREIQTTAKLKHPHIIQVFDSGQKGGEHYFVMEFVEGMTLNQWLNQKPTTRDSLILIKKSLLALHYAHQQGVIHRDIKPGNILVNKEGEPKITDFGLAKDTSADSQSQKITNTGVVVGTPAYMPPEQATGKTPEIDEISDVYSMGICLYEALTSRCPFVANSIHALFYKVIHNDPDAPSKLNTTIHRDLETIVLKAIDKNKQKRYQSAQEFADDIERFLNGYPILARPTSRLENTLKWCKRNRQSLLIGILIFFLCVALFGYLQFQSYQQKQKLFDTYVQTAQKEAMLAYQAMDNKKQEESIKLLLKTLDLLNNALSLKNTDFTTERKKYIIGKTLIELACQREEYDLAHYIARDLSRLISLKKQEASKILQQIHHSKNKNLKKHNQRLHYWIQKFRNKKQEKGDRENAIFEISKMPEIEIMQQLLKIVDEGTTYFLESHKKEPKQIEFFETMVTSLGRQENPLAGRELLKSLEKLAQKIAPLPKAMRTDEDTLFMITLAQALGNSKATHCAKPLDKIRWKMGVNGRFWKQTEFPFQILVQLDGLTEIKPPHANGYVDRGLAKQSQGDLIAAIADFNEAIKLNPKLIRAFINRGNAKFAQEDYLSAIQDYSAAIKLKPQNKKIFAKAYSNRGLAKIQIDDFEGTIADCTAAIALNPSYPIPYSHRGFAKAELEQYKEAILDYSEAIRLNPQHTSAWIDRGATKARSGDFNGAIQDSNKAIQLYPQSARAYNWRAFSKFKQNQLEEALEDYTKAIRLDPQYNLPYDGRGQIKAKKGNSMGAIEDYNEGIRLSPSYSTTYFHRGELNYFLNKREEAKKDFQKFIEEAKTSTNSQTQQKRKRVFQLFPELQK